MGLTDELLHHPVSGKLHSTPHQRPKFSEDVHIWGSTEEKEEKTTKLLFFVLFFFFVVSVYLLHFFVCAGLQIQFLGALMDFLKLYLVPTSTF